MAEDHDVGVGEAAAQPGGPAARRAAVVDHRHAHARQIQLDGLGKLADQLAVVVAEHGVHRRVPPEVLEHVRDDDVAGVQDVVGRVRQLPYARRQRP